MFYEVEYTNEFDSWWDELSARAQDDVSRVVKMLTEQGPQLPYPHCSAVRQSRHGLMRELRIQSGGRRDPGVLRVRPATYGDPSDRRPTRRKRAGSTTPTSPART